MIFLMSPLTFHNQVQKSYITHATKPSAHVQNTDSLTSIEYKTTDSHINLINLTELTSWTQSIVLNKMLNFVCQALKMGWHNFKLTYINSVMICQVSHVLPIQYEWKHTRDNAFLRDRSMGMRRAGGWEGYC